MRNTLIAVVLGTLGATPLPAAERNVYYILDASGSMWAEMDGSTRIEIAKDLLLDRLPTWRDQDANIGLVAYGHNTRGDCSDIEVLVDLKPLDEAELTRAISEISPKGKTPIAASIQLVADRLRVSEEAAHVILISDGEETCHPDPCEAVAELKALGIEFTMDVIGFDITEAERSQLQCLAAAAGGRYFAAEDAPQLHEAIVTAEETEPVEKIAQNVQIILDRSEGMRAPFEGQTKHAVALRHLERKLQGPAAAVENLSLRTFGGSLRRPRKDRARRAVRDGERREDPRSRRGARSAGRADAGREFARRDRGLRGPRALRGRRAPGRDLHGQPWRLRPDAGTRCL